MRNGFQTKPGNAISVRILLNHGFPTSADSFHDNHLVRHNVQKIRTLVLLLIYL